MTDSGPMKRKRRWLVALAAIAVLLIVVLGSVLVRMTRRGAPSADARARGVPVGGSDAYDKHANDIAQRAKQAKTEDERLKILANAPRMLQAYMLAKASIVEVPLHGMVVDEAGKSIAGAKIYYNTGGGLLGGATGAASTVTDAQGRFLTEGKGSNLVIQSIEKEGYQIPVEIQRPAFVVNRSSGSDDWEDFSYDKPKVFKAWRIPPNMIVPDRLLKSDYRTQLYLHPKHRSRDVALFGASHYGTDRAVSSQRPRDFDNKLDNVIVRLELLDLQWNANEPDKNAWKLRMSVVHGGGFVQAEINDLFLADAPEAGYQQSIELTSETSDGVANGAFTSFWYVYLANHKKYGRIRLDVTPPGHKVDQPVLRTHLLAAFNLTGQHYLLPYNGEMDW
jgi:hypothetical protein